jgi:hypothetical protein
MLGLRGLQQGVLDTRQAQRILRTTGQGHIYGRVHLTGLSLSAESNPAVSSQYSSQSQAVMSKAVLFLEENTLRSLTGCGARKIKTLGRLKWETTFGRMATSGSLPGHLGCQSFTCWPWQERLLRSRDKVSPATSTNCRHGLRIVPAASISQ